MQNDAIRRRFSRVGALSIEQENAINLLLTGASDQSVASRLKLGRATVNRWRLYHPLFKAELNRRRAAIRDSGLDGARSLVPRAIETVRDQIVNGDGQLALAFLDKAGFLGTRSLGPSLLADPGPTTLDAVLDEEIRRRRAGSRLPDPTATPSTNGATAGTSTPDKPAPAVDSPITDDDREAILDDLLSAALSDEPLDLPAGAAPDPPDSAGAGPTATAHTATAPTGGAPDASVVRSGSMSSFS